ncbi:MAG TPA: SbmA/BacA-like family transporter [Beijerinckiaceae bacterium]|jgi:putative ATP-binding cassette transporter|nr:SbmA/BacA-like family transporter [Beijerinckiaceae bacterium]
MKVLGGAVAVAAILCLAAGIGSGASQISGIAVNPASIGVGVVGLLLAYVTLRGHTISTFLRIFLRLFAFEYVVLALAFAASNRGFWPAFLADAAPPSTLCITIAVFGLIIYSLSYIPVIGQITRLADPYFETDDPVVAPVHWLRRGRWRERHVATALIMLLVVINQLQVGISVRLSFFNRDWFNAIQNKDQATFWTLLFTVFMFWAFIAIASNLIEYFFQQTLLIYWRQWLTKQYSTSWLGRGGIYRMGLIGDGADNPDQRIAEDIRSYLTDTYSYSITLIQQVSTLVSFSLILWSMPAEFVIPGTDIVVPGLPFWVAMAYSFFGTWITHLIGRPLVKLEFAQERYEANFRFSLARLREYAEQVALLRGERSELSILSNRFTDLVGNYFRIVSRVLKLSTFTSFYGQISPILPYVIIAPYYFADKVTLGQMSQVAGAFGRVADALSYFVDRYRLIARYKANVDRLTTFGEALRKARALGTTPPHIDVVPVSGKDLAVEGLSLKLPDGREIVQAKALSLKAGSSVLVTGPSGSGKSTLFRAIAGIWPYGQGRIDIPDTAKVLLLPQRPYVPSGTLKTAATYPATEDAYSDEAVRDALKLARLAPFAERIHEEENWGQRLSGGEQQRLAIARALLDKPDWLFLDEATSALDEKLEAEIYAMLREQLPNTSIISIGHRSTLIGMHDSRIEMQPTPQGAFVPAPI